MATAIAASYMNIPLIHTMGGEVSGTIDERIRHAVTKLSDLHFPASEDAKNRILKLGENKLNVFNVGCPRIDTVKAVLEKDPKINRSQLLLRCTTQEARPTPSTDDFIDLSKPFLLVSQHPVTTEFGENERHINQTLEAIEECDTPAVILWPNSDAGSDEVSRGMRKWRERTKFTKMHFFKDLDNSLYIKLMAATGCLVGNSSSGIREGAFIGTPVVNIGTRQNNRERGVNVIDVDPKKGLIVEAIKKQLNAGRYPRNNIYGDGNASDKIIKILKKI
jgi:UDP-hydrolysing UDP-N-acetyl-D-glucosamine 2-epimerase